MYTILGAGGAIADALVPALVPGGEPIRLVSRHPRPLPGAAETVAADLTRADDTVRAMAGSRIAFLTVGLPYDVRVWREQWPRIMGNAIAAAQRTGTSLVFFDNVYMYGRVSAPMTEATPFNPVSRKGEIRARIATMLLDAVARGYVTAMIARAADFYGPRARTGVGNVMVMDALAAGKAATWLATDQVPHAFTYVPDAADALVRLAGQRGRMGADVAPAHRRFTADRARVRRAGRRRARRAAATSRGRPLDDPRRRTVRSHDPRARRDALPVRGALPVRLVEVRTDLRRHADALRGRDPRDGTGGATLSGRRGALGRSRQAKCDRGCSRIRKIGSFLCCGDRRA